LKFLHDEFLFFKRLRLFSLDFLDSIAIARDRLP